MLLVPYKADVELGRWPVLTLLVSVICLWVFARQVISQHSYERAIDGFCSQQLSREERLVVGYLPGHPEHFCSVLLEIRQAQDTDAAIDELSRNAAPVPFYRDPQDRYDFVHSVLADGYARFDRAVPPSLTERLHFDPNHPTLSSMLTAAFTHGDWWHVISNLIFFFAFAASAEVIAGYAYYSVFFVVAAVGTHLAYSYSVRGVENALPTVGLSGVVMAMMAYLATIAPTLKIRCFFWLLVFIRIFRIPALLIAGFYVLENVVDYMQRSADDNVNYVAHLSGAFIGAVAGVIYKFRHREFLHELLPE